MVNSSRVALVALWVVFFLGSFLFIINQNPEAKDALENWWDSVSTGNSGIYGTFADDDHESDNDDDGDDDETDDDKSVREENNQQDTVVVAIRGSNRPSQEITGNGNPTTFEHQGHFGEGLPNGVSKYPFMPKPDEIDDQHRICFVNVGKTAGSSVACSLGFAYDLCPIDHVRIPNGNLPHYTTSMIHKDVNGCQTDSVNNGNHNFTMFMFAIRNPLERIKTWFAYERPRTTPTSTNTNTKTPDNSVETDSFARKKRLFIDCPFHTLDDLGGKLGLGGNNDTVCSQRAWNAILGLEGYSEHNFYNYGYYMNKVTEMMEHTGTSTPLKPRYIALRTEHLEDDWRTIETKQLNGLDPFRTNFSFPSRHTSYRLPGDSILSSESQANLCRALCNEIQIYKRLLEQSENLGNDDYVDSIRDLQESCPYEAINAHCS